MALEGFRRAKKEAGLPPNEAKKLVVKAFNFP
jgi:hypothetical protein